MLSFLLPNRFLHRLIRLTLERLAQGEIEVTEIVLGHDWR
jgi:hypothetical protein